MKYGRFLKTGLYLLVIIITANCTAQKSSAAEDEASQQANPVVTAEWVKTHLRKTGLKIILTAEQLQAIKTAVKNDEAIKAYYQYLLKGAESILPLPVLERKLEGRRLLTVSREAVKRISTLSIVYAICGEQRFLDRVNAEMVAVCSFIDWNPGHFLDVGEMAYAVAAGLDWTGGDLPEATKRLAKGALIEKALKPGLQQGLAGWVSGTNNWNQVCHGGLSVAAIAIADEDPALAAQIISRAVKYIPNALKSYAPDGAYPEGASYWGYGTSYSLLTISAFESAFGTDFGMSASPGFIQSALFVKMLASPSGLYFNYFDSGSGGVNSMETQELLSWFSNKGNNAAYFDKNKLITIANATSGLSKLNGAALTWMVKAKGTNSKPFPLNYKGEGENPIVIFKSATDDSSRFFLGAKGGAARLSHGDMDAGTFVFDLHGVRWSVDLGMPNYTELEAIIGVSGLWDNKQTGKRWTLMGKNNFGHSTLTINNQLHNAGGQATLISFKDSKSKPEAEFNLTPVLEGQLTSAKRKFTKISNLKLEIEDDLQLSDSTRTITWAMMTVADAVPIKNGVLLTQNGKKLKVLMKKPLHAAINIISKDPPPLPYDMKVKGLKRLEFTIDAKTVTAKNLKLLVELNGE